MSDCIYLMRKEAFKEIKEQLSLMHTRKKLHYCGGIYRYGGGKIIAMFFFRLLMYFMCYSKSTLCYWSICKKKYSDVWQSYVSVNCVGTDTGSTLR